jgi:hypothetical protein
MTYFRLQLPLKWPIAIAVATAAGLGQAQGPAAIAAKPAAVVEPMQISLVRTKIVNENGKETRQSAAIAKPGDVFEEVVTYKNVSNGALTKVQALLPVPPNTELVMASVIPANAKASVDGNVFADMPLKRKIRQPNGVEIEQVVPLSEYRYLRWDIASMPAGSALPFSARFKISNTPAASVASAGATGR